MSLTRTYKAEIEVKNRRVVIIDPPPEVRRFFRQLLESLGPQATMEGTGELRTRFNRYGVVKMEFTDNL